MKSIWGQTVELVEKRKFGGGVSVTGSDVFACGCAAFLKVGPLRVGVPLRLRWSTLKKRDNHLELCLLKEAPEAIYFIL